MLSEIRSADGHAITTVNFCTGSILCCIFYPIPDYCFKLRKHLSHFMVSIWLLRQADVQLRNSPRFTRGSFLLSGITLPTMKRYISKERNANIGELPDVTHEPVGMKFLQITIYKNFIMKNPASPRNNSKKGFSNSKPPARDKLDSRGDLEINEQPSGNNKKELKIGEKNEYNDPQGTRRDS